MARPLRPGALAVLVGALVALLSGCATTGPTTGTIAGRVRFADAPPGALRNALVTAWPDAPAPATPPRRGLARVEIDAGQFSPATLIVAAGTRVEFRNKDSVFHIPFSRSPDGAFELGRCAPGSAHSVTLDHETVVQVYCALHPSESMTVIVTPDRWHVRPAADGAFAFRNVPFGAYFVRVAHPTLGEVTKRVEVGPAAPARVSLER